MYRMVLWGGVYKIIYTIPTPSTIQSHPEYDIYPLWIYIELCGAPLTSP